VRPGELLLGKFRVEERIGAGGMGVVYGGRHVELAQPIAIKFLLAHDAARDVRRFLREARAVAMLDSPHVARVLDAGVTVAQFGAVVPFIVLERLHGCDLETLLKRRGRLPVAEAIDYVLQACRGAAEAHGAGIVHRDLKPGNLFRCTRRDGSPVVKLLDFGIAKHVAGATAELAVTAEGEAVGTPLYMAPEQVRGGPSIDARTDVWALGVILYELVTGTTPFRGDTQVDLFASIVHGAPRPLPADPALPPGLAAVLSRCFEKQREARFASVEELARALESLRDAEVDAWAQTAPMLERRPPRSRRARATARVALAVLTALGVLGGLAAARVATFEPPAERTAEPAASTQGEAQAEAHAQAQGEAHAQAQPPGPDDAEPLPVSPFASLPPGSRAGLPTASARGAAAAPSPRKASPRAPAARPLSAPPPRQRTDW
jgi:serine/threonine-protein kinase